MQTKGIYIYKGNQIHHWEYFSQIRLIALRLFHIGLRTVTNQFSHSFGRTNRSVMNLKPGGVIWHHFQRSCLVSVATTIIGVEAATFVTCQHGIRQIVYNGFPYIWWLLTGACSDSICQHCLRWLKFLLFYVCRRLLMSAVFLLNFPF